MTVISEWAVKDSLTGVVYPQPNRLIAEKVAEMHRQCEVIPLVTYAPEYEYGYAPLATSREKFPTEREAKEAYWMYLGPIRKFRRLKPVLNKWEEERAEE